MSDSALVIVGLAAATISIRLFGVAVGSQLPQHGPVARALNALPGCLIVSLVAVMLLDRGPSEWLAGGIALAAAVMTRSLPLTMAVGIGAVVVLRQAGV